MTRFVLAAFVALSCTLSYAQSFVKLSLDKSSYQEGETAHLRYRLAALPESPGYEFFLSASLGEEAVEIKKITDTEFYSRLAFFQLLRPLGAWNRIKTPSPSSKRSSGRRRESKISSGLVSLS